MRKIVATAGILALVFTGFSCTGGSILETDDSTPIQANSFKNVTVEIGSERANHINDIAAFEKDGFTQKLKAEMISEGAMLEKGDLSLEITIDDIRLRSTGITWAFGVMAGIDRLDTTVLVKRGTQTVASFQTHAQVGAGFGTYTVQAQSRMDWMTRKTAQLILEELTQE